MTWPNGGVEPPPPGDDEPLQDIVDDLVLKPDIFAQRGTIKLLLVPNVKSRTVIYFVELLLSATCLKFNLGCVHPGNFGLIYYPLYESSTI